MAVASMVFGGAALSGCAPPNEPEIVAHRALGFTENGEENIPENVILAFQHGVGAEIDIRSDGDSCETEADPAVTGCFDLGHDAPNGRTLSEVFELLIETWRSDFDRHTLVLDIANDTGDIVSTSLMDYLAAVVPAAGLEALPILIQSSAFEDLERLAEARSRYEEQGVYLNLRLGITYFANPEIPLPYYLDTMVCNIAELPSLPPISQEVAVFGVNGWSSWKQALFATSSVTMVITDYPYRFAEGVSP